MLTEVGGRRGICCIKIPLDNALVLANTVAIFCSTFEGMIALPIFLNVLGGEEKNIDGGLVSLV